MCLLPDRCSIKDREGECANPPSYVVSIMHDSGEYMVGVVCQEHRVLMERRLDALQDKGDLPKGSIKFVELKAVGTDCITNYPDDLKL